MKCHNCDQEINTNSHIKKHHYIFFKIIIILDIIIIGLLIAFIFYDKKSNHNKGGITNKTKTTTTHTSLITNNKGIHSTFAYPTSIGKITLASIYDNDNKKYTDVDIRVDRLLSMEEINNIVLANNILKDNQDFIYKGIEYTVNFNDLTYLNKPILPILNSAIYQNDGNDYITYKKVKYEIKMYNIYNGNKISNNESATIKVIYSIPSNLSNYSICFGYYNETLGCVSLS